MTLEWSEHPAARQELFDAVVWYDDQERGLGDRLADELAAGVQLMREWPDAAPLYRGCPGRRRSEPRGLTSSLTELSTSFVTMR